MIRLAAAALVLATLTSPARADLQLCNRMSYVVEAAVGLETGGNVTTRGWFRVDPGQCRSVIQGAYSADMVYLHARTPSIYGPGPLPQSGAADLCVSQRDFTIAAARTCRGGQRAVPFAAVKPTESDKGATANLAEEADYTIEQARLAGIQRLLVVDGYDANPIDGLTGAKTDAALAQFLKDRKLPASAATAADFFDVLMAKAQSLQNSGFSWCNDTRYTVMAALGIVEMGAIVTRGWYRVEPGKCVKPDVRGEPHRLYTYAEAIDANGAIVKHGEQALAWGGNVELCTREGKFELNEHKNCTAQGLVSAPFAAVDVADRPSTIVRFKEPK
ncbi:MAG TPA: DUF1036 domain-containing protein [Pseudolabrys sp.]|nr:DUF1036 domain-containing protein [Pseudolabrys sp.]